MRLPRRTLATAALIVVAFLAGAAFVKVLDRSAASASVRGQAGLYQQILSDLQRDYYRPVDVARLGSSGIAALLAPLHDPYTVYFSPRQAKQFADQLSGTYSGIGTGVALQHGRLAVTEVFPGSPAAAAHIVPGEVIVSVDGVATAGHSLTADVARIAGPAGSHVSLKLQRPGHSGLIALVLTRRTISVPLTTSRLIVDRGTKVGYVHLSSFASGAGDQVERAVAGLRRRGARWIILDLRDNGGGLVSEAARVSGDFLPGGKTVVTMQGLHSPRQVVSATGGPATRLPLVVLVNGNTASASEIVTGALQDYRRATVIGTRTFGKGVVQDTLPLSGGAELKITVASYRTPLGRDLNHKGIEPSIVVPARPGARADAALARALRFIATGR